MKNDFKIPSKGFYFNRKNSLLSRLYGDRDFAKKLLRIFVPAVLQSFISIVVLYVDNFSLAILIEDKVDANSAKNALGLANPLINFLIFVSIGWFSGISVMMSQYYGSGNQLMTRKTTALRIWSSLIVLMPFIIVLATIPGQLITISSNIKSGSDFELAKTYLWVSAFTFIPYAIASALSFSLQETKKAGISFIAAAVGMLTNIILDPIMIIICKDVKDAVALVAMSTGIARVVQTIFIILYIIIKKNNDIRFFREWKIKWLDFKKIINNGLSVFINEVFFGLAATILMMCLLRFNDSIHSATTNIVMMIELTSIIWPGMATASAVLVGSELGNGDIQQAKRNANKMLCWGLTFSLFMCLLLFCLSLFINPILSPNASDDMNQLATHMLWVLLPIIASQGIFSVTYYSIRCGGTKIVLLIDCAVMILWSVIMGSITFSGTASNWNPILFIFILEFNQIVKMIISLFIYKYYKWAKVLVTPQNVLPLDEVIYGADLN